MVRNDGDTVDRASEKGAGQESKETTEIEDDLSSVSYNVSVSWICEGEREERWIGLRLASGSVCVTVSTSAAVGTHHALSLLSIHYQTIDNISIKKFNMQISSLMIIHISTLFTF